jgi:hypothetical protein
MQNCQELSWSVVPCAKGKAMVSGTVPGWERDGIDPGWLYSAEIGSIRSAESYRPGGWWFLPQWLPDTA